MKELDAAIFNTEHELKRLKRLKTQAVIDRVGLAVGDELKVGEERWVIRQLKQCFVVDVKIIASKFSERTGKYQKRKEFIGFAGGIRK